MTGADPRPQAVGGRVVGARCRSCGYPTAPATPRCPVCFGPQGEAGFGPGGTVWSATVVHLAVGGRTPPYALAYVDLDDGPRVLACLDEPATPPQGTRVAVVGHDAGGDLVVRAERAAAASRDGEEETMLRGA